MKTVQQELLGGYVGFIKTTRSLDLHTERILQQRRLDQDRGSELSVLSATDTEGVVYTDITAIILHKLVCMFSLTWEWSWFLNKGCKCSHSVPSAGEAQRVGSQWRHRGHVHMTLHTNINTNIHSVGVFSVLNLWQFLRVFLLSFGPTFKVVLTNDRFPVCVSSTAVEIYFNCPRAPYITEPKVDMLLGQTKSRNSQVGSERNSLISGERRKTLWELNI